MDSYKFKIKLMEQNLSLAKLKCKVNEDVDDVVLDDMDDIVEDMKQGSRYIARYKLIAALVAENKVTLI